jgi:hypothetical protein
MFDAQLMESVWLLAATTAVCACSSSARLEQPERTVSINRLGHQAVPGPFEQRSLLRVDSLLQYNTRNSSDRTTETAGIHRGPLAGARFVTQHAQSATTKCHELRDLQYCASTDAGDWLSVNRCCVPAHRPLPNCANANVSRVPVATHDNHSV